MLDEMLQPEAALEAFAVNRWKEAETCGDAAGWFRAAEHFLAVQLFLTCLRLHPLANIAADLKGIADMRGAMPPGERAVGSFKPRLASRW